MTAEPAKFRSIYGRLKRLENVTPDCARTQQTNNKDLHLLPYKGIYLKASLATVPSVFVSQEKASWKIVRISEQCQGQPVPMERLRTG